MSKRKNQRIWVAVRVQRGFIEDVRAYGDEESAFRCESKWRRNMNPDYDEIGVSAVYVKPALTRKREKQISRVSR